MCKINDFIKKLFPIWKLIFQVFAILEHFAPMSRLNLFEERGFERLLKKIFVYFWKVFMFKTFLTNQNAFAFE